MTLRETAPDAVVPSGTDAVGRLFLALLFAWSASAFGLITVQVADLFADVGKPSATTSAIAAAIGVVVGVAVVLLMLRAWRRMGGQRVMRLGRRVWRTGELPASPLLRALLMRELERREKLLSTPPPSWVIGVIVLVPAVLTTAHDPSSPNVAIWVLILTSTAYNVVLDLVDRPRLPQLRALIQRLTEDTTGAL